jgi:ribonuclease HI
VDEEVNVDAALDRGAGKMGFGLIMRDHEGKLVAAKSIMRMGSWDSAAAEALAAYFGVILGQEIGVQKMILEGDAKQIIDAIQEKDRQDSMIGHLIDDVRLSLNNIPEWKVNHVFR